MPSVAWPQFVGGTYQALSPVVAADQCVNLYMETRVSDKPVKPTTLYGTPGRRRVLTLSQLGCRGWWSQNGRTFVINGPKLFELDLMGGTYTEIGAIPNDGRMVSYTSNGAGGEQMGIVGGGELNVLDLTTNALSTVTLPFSNPVMLAFMNGFAFINERGTPKVWYSEPEDLTSWDALDFFARSGTADNIVGIGVSRDRIWTWGEQTTTQFYNGTDPDDPFLPFPGTTMQVGLSEPQLLGNYQDLWIWVGTPPTGERRVYMASEPTAQGISTPPIERWLTTSQSLADGEMLIYQQDGHPFIAITLPSSTDAIKTYVYDLRESIWHARAGWDSVRGEYLRWGARGSVSVAGTVYVGDYANDGIYALDLDEYEDDGEPIIRERTAPYLGTQNQWIFVDQVELGTQPGVGLTTGQGSDPEVELRLSRDNAHTFISAGLSKLGKIGEYLNRTIWRRLGRSRLDRMVLSCRQSDPVKTAWTGLWLRYTGGSGQL